MALVCISLFAMAQQKIHGSIADQQTAEALAYVSVYNINTSKGSSSNFNGQFSIEATAGIDSLKISYLGYKSKTVLAQPTLNIRLTATSFTLNEVVISVNREQEKRTEAPIAIASISNKTIQENKPTTIDQVLNQTPGVNMVDLGNEQHTMSIRRPIDFGASYLYLEDGVPIRASGVFNHNALLEINMANTGRIEIIRGPASSMYGSEAIGGAVNFISKKASPHSSAGLSVQGNDIGYKRSDFYASNTFQNKLGVRLSGYYANQHNGIVAHSDFNKLALSLSLDYNLSDNSDITWSNTLIDYYSDMSGSLDSADFHNKTYESNQTFTNRKVNAYRSKLAFNKYWNDRSKSTITGYFRTNSVQQNPSYRVKDDFKPWIPSGDPTVAHGEINDNSFQSLGIIAQHKQDIVKIRGNIIAGGSFDFSPNTYQANYIKINKNEAGIYDAFIKTDSLLADYTAKLMNAAVYFQLKFQPIKGMNVIGALRYDHFNYNFDNHLGVNAFTAVLDGKNTFSQFTPKVGLTYDLKNNKGIYANFSQGFVPPQVSELYRGNAVPALQPVYYNNYEIGTWVGFWKKKAKLDLSIYKMDGTNEIISVLQNDGSTIRKNAGKTTHEGIEFGLHLHPSRAISLRVSGTHALHKFDAFNEAGKDYSGNKMPQAPEWTTNTQITYQPSFLNGFRASLEWQHVNGYYMDQANTKMYEGHDIFNFRMGYNWKSFEVWTNVMNASNQLYSTVARATAWGQSYSLGKPRNITLGLAIKLQNRK